MAIFKPGETFTSSIVVDGIILLAQEGKSATMHKANNNRRNVKLAAVSQGDPSSPKFISLDAQINNLDALFDQIEDPSPWDDMAATLEGLWQLCANCQPESSGKKIHRQYNYNRLNAGLPYSDTPPSTITAVDYTFNFFTFDWQAGPPNNFVYYDFTSDNGQLLLTAQLGRAQGNPQLVIDQASSGFAFGPGTPEYTWITDCYYTLGGTNPPPPQIISVPVCIAALDGTPGLSTVIDIASR
jgi:hypothetical protein